MFNIMNPKFRCFAESENAVTYRVEVSGTETTSAVEIVNYINNWIKNEALVTFDFIVIPVDSSCQVVVSSIADPECNSLTPASPTSVEFPVAAVGGSIGAVALIIVVFVVAILMIYICIHRKRSKSFHLSNRFVNLCVFLQRDYKLYILCSGMEMSAVQANTDTQEETLDTSTHVYDVVKFPTSSPSSPQPPAPEYDYITMGTVASDDTKDFEITDCAAYSVTGRH